MAEARDDTEPIEEARAILASGHALVKELAEEGVCEFERQAAPEAPVRSPSAPAPSPVQAKVPAKAAAKVAAKERSRDTRRDTPPPSAEDTPSATPHEASMESIDWSAETALDLETVRSRLGDCTRCGLCSGRKSIVFGDGNPDADLMFIGEGPGEQEDLRGLPFVGRAGELLTQMIEKGIGIPRSEVYICNIVKCRPPRNRNPLPPEVGACRPFLDGQILAVKPKVIVTLGKPAASLLLGRDIAITRLRGTWHEYAGIPLMPTLHPAYVLRQYTAENRRSVWQDLQSAIERVRA